MTEERNASNFLAETKFFEAYSRYREDERRYETWEESVSRVMDMHREKYSHVEDERLEPLLREIQDSYEKRKVLGAQRALQFGGPQILRHNLKIYNCLSSYADRPAFFGEAFYGLLCGCGVGFSVQKPHVNKLPKIVRRTKQPKIHVIGDSIEGWGVALDVLMSSFFEDGGVYPEYRGHRVYFDTSRIRPKNSKISGGFLAPGPDPLRLALDRIEHLLQGLTLEGERKTFQLHPIHVYDIVMYASDAVLAGGVRRSATIAIFSLDDQEMMDAKTGDWWKVNPQRARSNNSALVLRDEVSLQQFLSLGERIKQFGEPGFVFADTIDFCGNPCFTGDTMVAVADGRNAVSIRELAEDNVEFLVYSARPSRGWGRNRREWFTEIKKAIAFKTGYKRVIKVTLSNGDSFRCTPEHLIARPDGSYIEARESLGLEVESFFTYKDKGYRRINTFNNVNKTQHRMIWEHYNGDIPRGMVIDHKESGTRDYIHNLQMLTKEEHDAKTAVERLGDNNPIHKIKDRDGFSKRRSHLSFMENNPRFSGITDEEIIENARYLYENGYLITFEALRSLDDRSPLAFSKNRFGGSIHNLRKIVSGEMRYEKPKNIDYPKKDKKVYERERVLVTSIEDDGIEDVYDLNVPDNHNFYILTSGDDDFENSKGVLVHNCLEIGMYPQINRESGFQGCNLTDINGGALEDEEDFFKMCRVAAALGTLQAGYTDFRFMSDATKRIFEREALLGVSITGWMSNPELLFDEETLERGAEIVRETNEWVAEMIGINPAARTTCVKPSGTASVILECPSGIHPEHSPRFFRNIQVPKDSEIGRYMAEINPYMVEESVWSSGRTDYFISFPLVAQEGSRYKENLLGVNLLDYVRFVQKHWVEAGTNLDRCVNKTIRHNVSNTIMVDDWDEVLRNIYENRAYFTGVTLIPYIGDKVYAQAPFIKVRTFSEIVDKYGEGSLFASGLIVDGLKAFGDEWWYSFRMTEASFEESSDTVLKVDWLRRFQKFASTWFSGDVGKTEECLKDVYLLHKWFKVQQNMRVVDWSKELKEKKFVAADSVAGAECSGGSTDRGESLCVI